MDQYYLKTAIIDDKGDQLTYGELDECAKIHSHIISPRSVVIIIASNTIECLAGYIVCMKNKWIPMILRNNIDKENLYHYIDQYNVGYVWMPGKKYQLYDERFAASSENVKSQQELNQNFNTYVTDSGSNKYTGIYSCREYTLYKTFNENSKVNCEVNEELALLMMAFGSVACGKLVRISYENLETNSRSITKGLEITEEDIAITTLPMNSSYGLSVINSLLYVKGTLLVTEQLPYSRHFWNFFNKYKATIFADVPYTYEVLRKMGFKSMELPTLRRLMVSEGAMDPIEERYFIDYAVDNDKSFNIVYGHTEATGNISFKSKDVMKSIMRSVGRAIPEGQLWLENVDGEKITIPFIFGNIVYKGKNVAMGYALSSEDLNKSYEWEDVLYTGDVGYRDERGYYFVKERNDRIVKLNGMGIDLSELEELLGKKFQGYTFKCELDYFTEKDYFRMIKIEVSDERKDNENNSKTDEKGEIKETIGDEQVQKAIIDYVSYKTGFVKKYYGVVWV